MVFLVTKMVFLLTEVVWMVREVIRAVGGGFQKREKRLYRVKIFLGRRGSENLFLLLYFLEKTLGGEMS